jgi:hypothetical protein
MTPRLTSIVLAFSLAACTSDDPAMPDDSSSTAVTTSSSDSDTGSSESSSSEGSTSSSSGADSSSTGEPPPLSPCELAEIAQGIVGRTDVRTCDTEGDCVDPESGVELWLFDDNPQMGGSTFEPGTLNPDVPMLEMTTSGADGRFQFALGASSYHVCTPVGADEVICSDAMIVVGANPLHVAFYEHGNGESWSTASCLD